MNPLTYAGIGARATPPDILRDMTVMAGWLGRTAWHLSSGGAKGAETAFANGAPEQQRTLYLPWRGYNGHRGQDIHILSHHDLRACMDLAAPLHPAWSRCSPAVRKLHARNAAVLLGPTLDQPVDAIVCWTPDGEVTGGTGMGLRIAAEHRIPVMNLARLTPRETCERLLAIRRSANDAPVERARGEFWKGEGE